MRSSKTGRQLGLAMSLSLIVLSAGCHNGNLSSLTGTLVFSSPDEPAELMQPDAGVVQIAFGQVLVGASKTMTLAFASIGTTVTLGTVTALQPDAEFSLPFVPGTVVQTMPSQITVSFTPTSAGDKSAVLKLTAYAPGTETVLFELSGVGVSNGLSVVPDPVDFGEVELNHSQSVTLTITNNSPLAQIIAASPLQGQDPDRFSLGPLSSTALAPGASATQDVAFMPLVDGAASASFIVSPGTVGSAAEPVTVNLAGTGIDSWIQVTSPLEFGFVQRGDSVVKLVVVRNLGSYTTLHLLAPAPAVVQPAGAVVFSVAATAPTVPVAIPPGQSALIPISFTPPKLGEFTGTLFLTTDDPLAEYPAVELDGYGGGPRIQCLPQLALGPTAVGHSFSQPALCSNTGADIPSHPEFKLQIPASGISTDDPAFRATLSLPDGGPAGPGDSVDLSSGQSATIEVELTPLDAGIYEGRLTVASSDTTDPDAGTLLTGEGVVPGPCNLEVIPRELSFGNVPPRSVGTQQFELENSGQNLCIVNHVTLDPGSAAGFSLPQGDPGYQLLSYPGDPDNPAGLPSVLQIPVQYASSGVVTAAGGTIDIAAPNASPPNPTVALTATSAFGCFTVEPQSFDFGTLPFNAVNDWLCMPGTTTFTGVNGCGAPVIVSQIEIARADGGTPFALTWGPPLPAIIDAGDQILFQAEFAPSTLGPESGSILVTSSASPGALAVAATLKGDAELVGFRTDIFTVPAPPKELDVLWILDEDDDLDQVQSVAALLPQLIDSMNKSQIDWQMAVTSTDTCDGGSSDLGFFEPCDHCISQASTDPLFVTPGTADAGDAIGNLFSLFDESPQGGFCEGLNGDEHFFDSIADAFATANLTGHNAGFIRPEADLAVVLVNGDAEDDANGGGAGGGPYLTSLNQVTALVEGLKPDAGMASVSYINSGAGAFQAAQNIGKLVQATNGTEIDSSQAAAVWQNELVDLFAFGGGSVGFRLSNTPASALEIEVYVSGVLVTDWAYDPFQQEIIFDPADLPAPGSTITVTYWLGCL